MKRNRKWRISRDTIIFCAGLAGFAYELLIGQAERPTLIIACMAMMGLPAFLRTDESKTLPKAPDEVDPPQKVD